MLCLQMLSCGIPGEDQELGFPYLRVFVPVTQRKGRKALLVLCLSEEEMLHV